MPRIVRSLYLIPMFVPVVIAVYAAITFYVDRGVLAALLHVVGIPYVSPAYKPGGVVLTRSGSIFHSPCSCSVPAWMASNRN